MYQHFATCGNIDHVRIIRDNKTGIGKGFGYVQFKTADTVALALRLDGTQMGERKIRVSRCVKKLVRHLMSYNLLVHLMTHFFVLF